MSIKLIIFEDKPYTEKDTVFFAANIMYGLLALLVLGCFGGLFYNIAKKNISDGVILLVTIALDVGMLLSMGILLYLTKDMPSKNKYIELKTLEEKNNITTIR